MTTTQQFQAKPDFYTTEEECTKREYEKISTNPKYKGYDQVHFTAADLFQFQEYRDMKSYPSSACMPPFPKENIFSPFSLAIPKWQKYKNLSTKSTDNTFNYIFHKFKKGIFVKISQGKMKVFLPFSNRNFRNEWEDRIKVDPKYKDINEFFRYSNELAGKKFNPNFVDRNKERWYSNNCLLRYEFPPTEKDTNNPNCSDMLKTLCNERVVPDMEFFINRRDFPLLKTDETEPYDHMFDSDSFPLISHIYDTYTPILSMVTSDKFADIPMPTGDDWSRVSRKEGKFFPHTCNRTFTIKRIPWKDRKPIAVFRGSSTGCGVTKETNPRLNLAYLSFITPPDIKDNLPLLDAGITDWNTRPRKVQGEKYLQTIDYKNFPFKKVSKLTPQEQAHFKYVINVPGHVAAYRLSLELESGTCILLVESKYKLWFHSFLKPFEHFVPVKNDLSDLVEKIKWCKANDKKCEKIAENAFTFAQKYLCKDGILDYLQKLLFDLKKMNGVYLYNVITLPDLQYKMEEKEIIPVPKFVSKKFGNPLVNPYFVRNYATFKAIEWVSSLCMENFIPFLQIFPQISAIAYKKETARHIFFISQVLNPIFSQIPNFSYIFGKFGENHVFLENLENFPSFENFLSNNHNQLFLQICLALIYAQKCCLFSHNNLNVKNIKILELKSEIVVQYPISENSFYSLKTKLIPVFTEYSKVHIVYKGIHYGDWANNLFSFDPDSDIKNLLQSMSSTQAGKILGVSAWEVQKVLENVKMSNLINLPFQTSSLSPYLGNPRQIFEYFYASSTNEKINSFLDCFRRVKKCEIKITNPFYKFYALSTIYENLLFTYKTFVKKSKGKQNFGEILKIIESFKPKTGIEKEKIVFSLPKIENIFVPKTDSFRNIFQNPKEIDFNLAKIKNLSQTDYSPLETRMEITKTFLQLENLNPTFEFYKKEFQPLFQYDNLPFINMLTLKYISLELCRENLKEIEKVDDTCSALEEYKKMYEKILYRN